VRFEAQARQSIQASDHAPLVDYKALGPDASLSIPTPEHYLPLLYVLGASDGNDTVQFPVEGIDGGSVSMLALRLG
jgi:4,5-DOPA dioxygenase extradiol